MESAMNCKLRILVGSVKPNVEVDLDSAELYSECMPGEMVKYFEEHITGPFEDGVKITVRVYTDTIINWIGAQIELGTLSHNNVTIITEYGSHRYNENGVIGDDWPFGIFNW
jgi:hypothetical protein